MKRSGVRQSVCPISQTQQRRAVGLLLSAVRAKHIDRQRPAAAAPQDGAQQQMRQCHVDSRINETEHGLGLLSILALLKF